VEEEKGKAAPTLGVGGAYERDMDATNVGIVVIIGVPIFNRNRGAVAAAEGERRTAAAELEYLTGQIEQAVMAAHAEAVRTGEAAAVYRDDIIPRAEDTNRAVEKMYRLGESSYLEVIDASRVVLDSWREYLSLLAESHQARARLAWLMGEE
jgi:cobalt-zinc-cadmium efflux system outer membrane protein